MMSKRFSLFLVFSLFSFLFLWTSPSNAQFCFWDCDAIDDNKAKEIAQTDNWKEEFDKYMKDAHCDDCYNNAMKIRFQNDLLASQREEECNNNCSGSDEEIAACKRACEEEREQSRNEHRQALQGAQQILETVSANNQANCAGLNAMYEEVSARMTAFASFNWAAAFSSQSTVGVPLFSKILNSYNQDGSYGCWFCPLFDVTFDIVNDLATNFYEQMRTIFLSALMVGGVAWLCWIVLQFFLVVHGANVGEFMTTLLKAFFRLMFGAALLWAPSYEVFDFILSPVVSFASGLSTELMGTAGFITPTVTTVTDIYDNGCADTTVSTQQNQMNLCSTTDPNDSRFVSNGQPKALSSTVYDGLSCVIKTASLNFVLGLAIGATFLVHSLTAGPLGLPHLGMLLIALLQIIGYLILFIVVPFKFIDILVRLGFVAILLPLYILLAVFPATIGYTKKAWDLLISCLFSLIVLSILIVICLRLIAGV